MPNMHHKNRKHADRISHSVAQCNTKISFWMFMERTYRW